MTGRGDPVVGAPSAPARLVTIVVILGAVVAAVVSARAGRSDGSLRRVSISSGPAAGAPHRLAPDAICGPVPAGHARCFARMGARSAGATPNTTTPPGYAPADFDAAYFGPGSSGTSQTIAVVDAYDDPSAESDLQVYRTKFGLPPCTTANGCFAKRDQRGETGPFPQVDNGWAVEVSVDLDAASATCPQCHLLLIEADDNSAQSLAQGASASAALGASVVTNSYGSDEFAGQGQLDALYQAPGVLEVAASGDAGYGAQYPAALGSVVAVGGTTLTRAAPGPYPAFQESAWSGSGSGCSAYEAKPSWQVDAGCSRRTIADVSAAADPGTGANPTGAAVYDTTGEPGWLVIGGTSLAAPLIAGLAANTAHGADPGRLYAHAQQFHDITTGNNGTCSPTYLCVAGPGYDGPTGLGTPAGLFAFGARIPLRSGQVAVVRGGSD